MRRPSHVATNPGGPMQPLRLRIDRIVDFGTVVSLVGVAYLIGCLGILFKLLPDLWWGAWEAAGLQLRNGSTAVTV